MYNIDKQLEEIYKKACIEAGYKNELLNQNKNKTLTGKYYEDVVRTVIEAINKFYPTLEILAPTGFVYSNSINPKTGAYDQSNQTDIIVTLKEANKIKLTSTDDGIHIKDAIAIIEVKKNFKNKNIFAESIWNTTSINKFLNYCDLMNSSTITTDDIIKHQGINCELKIDSKTPSIIIFGFDGFSNEETIRKHFKCLCEGKLEYVKRGKTNIPLKLEHLYEFPELIIDDKNAILKMTGLIQSHDKGLFSTFSSCGNINSELKIYIFKITLLYAIIKHLNNVELSNEILNKINSKPILFLTNPLVGIDLKTDTHFLCGDNNLISPYCEIENIIKLTEEETSIYWNIHLGKRIEPTKIKKNILSKLLSKNVLYINEGILQINSHSIVVENNNKFTIYILKFNKIDNSNS